MKHFNLPSPFLMTGGSQLGPVMKAFGTIHMRFCYTIVETVTNPHMVGYKLEKLAPLGEKKRHQAVEKKRCGKKEYALTLKKGNS